MIWTIPLTVTPVAPVRDFTIDLDGVVFRIVLTWRERPACWYLDLYANDGTALLKGHALRPDTPTLVRRSGSPWPAGRLMLLDVAGAGGDATLEGLGATHELVYADADAIADAAEAVDYLTVTGQPE